MLLIDFLKCIWILYATIDSTATFTGDLFVFLSFSRDSIILWLIFSLKSFDNVFEPFHEILLFCGRRFSMKSFDTVFDPFHEILLFCGRRFSMKCSDTVFGFFMITIVLLSLFSMKCSNTVLLFHEILLFCRRCLP